VNGKWLNIPLLYSVDLIEDLTSHISHLTSYKFRSTCYHRGLSTGVMAHPYYPLGADIVGYSPNQTSVLELLVSAGGGCAALLGLTFAVTSYVRPSLRLADRIAILWFVLCTNDV